MVRNEVHAPTNVARRSVRKVVATPHACHGSLRRLSSLCRRAIVAVQPAEEGDRRDRAGEPGSRALARDRNLLTDPLVRPSRVEVAQCVFSEDMLQVCFSKDHNMIEAFASNTPEKSFAHRIHQGSLNRGAKDANPGAGGDSVEDSSELIIAITEDEFRSLPEGRRVAQLLRSPRVVARNASATRLGTNRQGGPLASVP